MYLLPVETGDRSTDVRGEQRRGRAGVNGLAIRREPDRNRHEPAIQCDVEQFPAVATPAHLRAASRRNRLYVRRAGKLLEIDLNWPVSFD